MNLLAPRFLPCGHTRLRITNATTGTFQRRCRICKTTYTFTITHAAISHKVGAPVYTARWDKAS